MYISIQVRTCSLLIIIIYLYSSMNCKKCDNALLPPEDICFYAKSTKSVDLMIRHEKAAILEETFKLAPDRPNYFKIICTVCDSPVGKKHPNGPNSSSILAFGNDKIVLLGRKLTSSKKDAWYNVYLEPPFDALLVRDSTTFFGHSQTEDPDVAQAQEQNEMCPIVWPELQELSHFKHDDVIMSDVIPRDYQIAAYIEGLQRDLILVLPTGCGKTLVASIAAARMKALNPGHMVLFLVDRVPLVFQQGESISIETHLNVCSLTSEFNTNLKRRKLTQGVYDVLVSTAGSFLSLKRYLSIDRFCYVIFDECHHATKSHDYKVILEQIRLLPPSHRPRVLGLTASPPCTQDLLEEFRRTFFDAPICHDLSLSDYEYAAASIDTELVEEAPVWELRNYQFTLEAELYKLVDEINSIHGGKVISKDEWGDKKNRDQLITALHQLDSSKEEKVQTTVEAMKKICEVLTNTEILGITYDNNKLEDLAVYQHLEHRDTFSPKLNTLLKILEELADTSKIIIFVRTRVIAHILNDILKRNTGINKKFSPQKIVGQYGLFGMSWINEQEEVLEKFRNGPCSLLVSTSVLEEGLDIPTCDVVIRFDRIDSFISYKQSKGRARKKDKCKFILIMSKEDEACFAEIYAKEAEVKQLLREHFSAEQVPSDATLVLQEQVKADMLSSPRDRDTLLNTAECAVEFYLSGALEIFDVRDKIAEFLRDDFFLKVNQIDQASDKCEWKRKGIFPPEDSLLILGLGTQHRNIYQRYKQLTVEWSFSLSDISTSVWTRVQVPTSRSLSVKTDWGVTKLSLGRFIDRRRFQLNRELVEKDTETEVDDDDDRIGILELIFKKNIEITLLNNFLLIEIPFASIRRFVLAHWKDSEVTLYLPLSYSPTIRSNHEGPRLSCIDCEYLTHFGQNPVLSVTLKYDKANWSELWIFLHSSCFPVPVFDSHVTICSPAPPAGPLDHPQYWEKPIQDCLWLFYVLKSNRDICIPDETIRYLSHEISQTAIEHMPTLQKTFGDLLSELPKGKTIYFCDLLTSFREKLARNAEGTRNPIEPPNNFCHVECAMLTPSCIIPMHPILSQCNRLYRKYPQERFLNLAFREEHGEGLNCSEIIERVNHPLREGIDIEGIKFYFLVCSGSQMRSKRAIFLHIPDTDSPADKIRCMRAELIGDSVIPNVTKYLSRLGLFCTSDYPICDIEEGTTLQLDDLKADNEVMLTDGNGKIDKNVAEEVFERVKLKQTSSNTSAIQIRLAGLKGVFTIVDPLTDPDFSAERQHCSILYRESMKKIAWTHSTLCLVKVGKYNKLYFNTQMLTLLSSLEDTDQQWDPKPRLRELYKKNLELHAELFKDTHKANSTLLSNFPNYSNRTSKNFDILSEPFLVSLLRCVYTHSIKMLISRFHFLVGEGCILMGIPDPIGVLKDGEVFIRYEDTEGNIVVRTGRILVYKNPCLHPGDLLVPTAVDRPELHHLHNVIVFPITGKKSLPACSGGGDLDGDEFGIIWDEALIPPEGAVFEPLNYDKVLDNYKAEFQEDETDAQPAVTPDTPIHNDNNVQSLLAEAYCKIVSNDLLGIISHYHVAVSDMKPDGAKDDQAIQLAKLASIAVDSPKTGVTPVIPQDIKALIKDKGYPDFMEKVLSTSYPSTKLLGELYQMAKSICFQSSEWENVLKYYEKHEFLHRIPANIPIEVFKIPGHQKYMENAKAVYFEYASALQRIMLAFGIETEAEVVLSLIIRCHPLLSADKGKTTSAVMAAAEHLSQEFRNAFYRGTDESEYTKKAAAWYLTVYREQPSEDEIFLSFPWLVGEYLCDILDSQEKHMKIDMYTLIGRSAREYLKCKYDSIRNVVDSKIGLLPSIDSAINSNAKKILPSTNTTQIPLSTNTTQIPLSTDATQIPLSTDATKIPLSTDATEDTSSTNIPRIFNVEAFGSVAKYHCELESDLDVSVRLTDYGYSLHKSPEYFRDLSLKQRRLYLLNTFISPSLGDIANDKSDKFNLEVPIVSCHIDPANECCSEISVDVTVESDGVLKCKHILDLYSRTKGMFYALLWILIHWARHVGILKSYSSPDSTGLILTAEFEALVLHIYNKMQNVTVPGDEIDSSFASMFNSLASADMEKPLGLALEEFFCLGYKLTSEDVPEIVYIWPIEGQPTHAIDRVALSKISGLLFQGWHCLMFTRDVSKLLERVDIQLRFAKRFSTYLSDRIRSSTQYYEKDLTNKTGCIVKLEEMGRNILLTAQGSASAIHNLSAEVSLIESNSGLTKRYRSNASRYMIDGNLALVVSNVFKDSKVKLKPFKHGCCKHFHSVNNKSVLVSTSKKENPDWKKEGTNKLQDLLWTQLKDFPVKNNQFISNLKFKTRFGSFYVLEGVDALKSIGNSVNVEEFESCLVKGKTNRMSETIPEKMTLPLKTSQQTEKKPPQKLMNFKDAQYLLAKKNRDKIESLSSGFCPGIYDIHNEEDLERSKEVFIRSLQQCDFTPLDREKTYTWRVEIELTVTQDVRLNLDSSFIVVDVYSRPYIWVLATILADRNKVDERKTHDLRLRAESSKPVEKDSELYSSLLPDGPVSSVIIFNDKDKPVPCERLKDRMKIIKHNREVVFYQLESIIAKISSGVEYCRENFDFERHFCELTLFHCESELILSVTSGNCSEIQAIAATAVDTSIKLSEAIYSNM